MVEISLGNQVFHHNSLVLAKPEVLTPLIVEIRTLLVRAEQQAAQMTAQKFPNREARRKAGY